VSNRALSNGAPSNGVPPLSDAAVPSSQVPPTNGINGGVGGANNFAPVVDGASQMNGSHQSHPTKLETAGCSHYYIVKNNIKALANLDDVERLTFHLCWAAQDSTSTLSYPDPALLADRLSQRGRLYIHKIWIGEEQSDRVTDYWPNPWSADRPGSCNSTLGKYMFYL
jgi:hypothetical protein